METLSPRFRCLVLTTGLFLALVCVVPGSALSLPTEREPKCGPVCAIACPYGNLLDTRGCPTCSCNECPLVKCAKKCPRGYKTDQYGCQTCQCQPACPLLKCANICPGGYRRDVNGCQTCDCGCGSLCKLGCPFGYETDASGCRLCKCKPRPGLPYLGGLTPLDPKDG